MDVLVKHGLRNAPHITANCREVVHRNGGPGSNPHLTDLVKHFVAASLAAAASDSSRASSEGGGGGGGDEVADRQQAAAGGAAAATAAADGERQRQRRCQQCDTVEGRLHKCRGCKQVYYCGTDCQALDWDLHKPLCKRVQRERQAAAAQSEAAA